MHEPKESILPLDISAAVVRVTNTALYTNFSVHKEVVRKW